MGNRVNTETEVYETYYHWLNKVEKGQMSKSYKMVLLERPKLWASSGT